MTTPDPLIPAATFHGVLLGLAGAARVGKDAVGSAMGDGWHRAAFADALKEDLRHLLALRLKLDPNADKARVRPLLVEYGRLAREVEPNHWVNRLRVPMHAKRVVVCDCRYPNEVEFIQSKGGLVVYLFRPECPPVNGEEARSLSLVLRVPGVVQVANDGRVDETAREVLRHVRKHYGEVR